METPEQRAARRAMKEARGDFKPRQDVVYRGVILVRDKTGRPKFDHDPRGVDPEAREAYRQQMSEAEFQEFFGAAP